MGQGVHIGASSRDGRGETITLVDPASGKAGTAYRSGSADDVADAVLAAAADAETLRAGDLIERVYLGHGSSDHGLPGHGPLGHDSREPA